jgi:hypothetical protein
MRSQIVVALAGGALVAGAAAGIALSASDSPDPAAETVEAVAADPGDRGRDRAPGQQKKETGERPADEDEDGPRRAGPKASVREFVVAKKEWTACVGTEAAAHEGPGRFDPEEACGVKPRPAHAGPRDD